MTDVAKALRQAFNLGQTYWQQADSESYSQQRKSDEMRAKFDALVSEVCSTQATPEAAEAGKDAIPEGWKLVPVEPTEAMLQAGYEGIANGLPGNDERLCWKAMLAAAPAAPLGGGER